MAGGAGDDPGGVGTDPAFVLARLVDGWADREPARPFLVEVGGRTASYGEVSRAVRAWAGVLQAHGLRAGDRALSFLPPSIDAHLVWMAAAAIGAVEVGANPELVGPLLDHVLVDSAPSLAVVLPDQTHLVPPALPSLVADPAVLADATLASDAEGADTSWPAPADPSCILYTSGTTGPAKGVVLTWAQMASTIGRIPRSALSGDDAVYAPWPMFHVTGRSPLLAMADVGGRVVLRPGLSVREFWADIIFHRCTSTTVGAVAPLLLQQDTPPNPLRWVFMAPRGALSCAVADRFGVEVVGNYGSTEMGFPILNRAVRPGTAHLAGWLRPGYRARLVLAGRDVADGEAGELWIQPPDRSLVLASYLGDTDDPVADGWYHTGDVMTRDDGGAFTFVDRLRDVVRRFGETISASVVEAAAQVQPDVIECAVVATPSEMAGEEVLLVVVVEPGRLLDPGELYHRLEAVLPRHARPAFVAVVDALPKTPTGKVRKTALTLVPGGPGVWESPASTGRRVASPYPPSEQGASA